MLEGTGRSPQVGTVTHRVYSSAGRVHGASTLSLRVHLPLWEAEAMANFLMVYSPLHLYLYILSMICTALTKDLQAAQAALDDLRGTVVVVETKRSDFLHIDEVG
jgi:hypothetical protein